MSGTSLPTSSLSFWLIFVQRALLGTCEPKLAGRAIVTVV
jgi:hypothetical protein